MIARRSRRTKQTHYGTRWKSNRPPRGSDTTSRLEEHVRTLERELSDVAAGVRTKAEVEAKYNFIRLFQQLPQREKVAKGRVESREEDVS